MSLKSQRRLASKILKTGKTRIWMDPKRSDEIESAMTREEIRKLISDKVIRTLPKKGISRGRAKSLREKKKKGLRKGFGSRKGTAKARFHPKRKWIRKIRALRKRLLELKSQYSITDKHYRRLYVLSGSGMFDSLNDLKTYIEDHNMWRRR